MSDEMGLRFSLLLVKNMNKYKFRLIVILLVQVAITIINNNISGAFNESNFYYPSNWSYWLGMTWGIFLILYVFRLGCPNCGANQVMRGFLFTSWRWPEDNCHKCGSKIE